jgi:hypothetical protein
MSLTKVSYSMITGAPVNVLDFGAVGNGVADDTTAINNAIAYVKSLPLGGAVYFPPGTYATGEINATLCGSSFNQTVKLFGAGRFMTKIIPNGIYPVILNMMGSNDMQISDLTIDSSAYTSQCAIFLARTTVSTNCNNNKFSNVFTTGSYAVASVVSNGSESSNWFNCRFENSYATADYRCFWTGGGAGVKALQNVTTINGGTVLDTNNPNTDNKMFGVEFYAPYASAAPVRFSSGAEYQFYGCTIVAGTANNCRLVTYGDPTGGRFNGPIGWFGCHFEVFGTGNTVHYLNAPGAECIFDGISSYSGYYVLSNNTSVIDFDRTNIAELPTLSSSTWTTPTTAPNSTGTNAYVYILSASSFVFKPNPSDGNLYLTGYSQLSTVDVTNYYGGATRFLTCYHTTVAAAVPTTGSFTVGETIQRETPVVGQPTGWKCTVSGTLGTLNASATTGGITINTNILIVNSATGLAEGQRINIAGAGGPFYVRKLSGTTAYLDSNSTATVVAAAVSFSNATLVALANL